MASAHDVICEQCLRPSQRWLAAVAGREDVPDVSRTGGRGAAGGALAALSRARASAFWRAALSSATVGWCLASVGGQSVFW